MRRLLVVLILVGAMSLSGAGAAEARIFEPQTNWWSSGQTCVATRGPPGRRWQALPPRSCAVADAIAPSASRVSSAEHKTRPAYHKRSGQKEKREKADKARAIF
jgi:hypothetical protein